MMYFLLGRSFFHVSDTQQGDVCVFPRRTPSRQIAYEGNDPCPRSEVSKAKKKHKIEKNNRKKFFCLFNMGAHFRQRKEVELRIFNLVTNKKKSLIKS